jgi:inositol oxygenase
MTGVAVAPARCGMPTAGGPPPGAGAGAAGEPPAALRKTRSAGDLARAGAAATAAAAAAALDAGAARPPKRRISSSGDLAGLAAAAAREGLGMAALRGELAPCAEEPPSPMAEAAPPPSPPFAFGCPPSSPRAASDTTVSGLRDLARRRAPVAPPGSRPPSPPRAPPAPELGRRSGSYPSLLAVGAIGAGVGPTGALGFERGGPAPPPVPPSASAAPSGALGTFSGAGGGVLGAFSSGALGALGVGAPGPPGSGPLGLGAAAAPGFPPARFPAARASPGGSPPPSSAPPSPRPALSDGAAAAGHHLREGGAAEELFYRLNHARQTVDFVRRQAAAFRPLDRAALGVWEALALLDELREFEAALVGAGTPPEPALSLRAHAEQSAEACRRAFPQWPWAGLAGLLHPLGKLLAHARLGAQPQWAVCGESFPVGCAHHPAVAHARYFQANPDRRRRAYAGPAGAYAPGCGLSQVAMSWSGAEYLHLVLALNKSSLPPEALWLLRHQRFAALLRPGAPYGELLSDFDRAMLPALGAFREATAYRRREVPGRLEGAALRGHYDALIARYLPPGPLRW